MERSRHLKGYSSCLECILPKHTEHSQRACNQTRPVTTPERRIKLDRRLFDFGDEAIHKLAVLGKDESRVIWLLPSILKNFLLVWEPNGQDVRLSIEAKTFDPVVKVIS